MTSKLAGTDAIVAGASSGWALPEIDYRRFAQLAALPGSRI
jgi:hypothetical protein